MAWFRKKYVDEYVLDYNGEYMCGGFATRAEAEAAARDFVSPDFDDGVPGSGRGWPNQENGRYDGVFTVRAIRRLNYRPPNKPQCEYSLAEVREHNAVVREANANERCPPSYQYAEIDEENHLRVQAEIAKYARLYPEKGSHVELVLAGAAAATLVAGPLAGIAVMAIAVANMKED